MRTGIANGTKVKSIWSIIGCFSGGINAPSAFSIYTTTFPVSSSLFSLTVPLTVSAYDTALSMKNIANEAMYNNHGYFLSSPHPWYEGLQAGLSGAAVKVML